MAAPVVLKSPSASLPPFYFSTRIGLENARLPLKTTTTTVRIDFGGIGQSERERHSGGDPHQGFQ